MESLSLLSSPLPPPLPPLLSLALAMMLTLTVRSRPYRYNPYGASKCKSCKSVLHLADTMYCQNCAYSKGKSSASSVANLQTN